jgi:hypothetical protein
VVAARIGDALMFAKPRKLKKATKKFLFQNPVRWTPNERRRFLRAMNRERRADGRGPIRRLPDERVSLLDL